MKTVIKDYAVRGRHFTITRGISNVDGRQLYFAIEDKYITDGKLNTRLNGFQMNCHVRLDECLNLTRIAVEVEYMKEHGATNEECLEYIKKDT